MTVETMNKDVIGVKLSIVVPVYNVEIYLRVCVDSLLQQTVAAYEIILVDDGSKDSSGVICDEYGEKYPHIKVVHKENAGLGMARNTGLEQVTGEYVMFVDSDDFCQPDMVEQMVAVVQETGCDTCKSSFNRVDMEGNFLYAETVIPGAFAGTQVQQELLPRLIGSAPDKKDSIPMSACCTMYSMEIIRSNSLRFVSERQWISEDIIFNISYYALANRVVLSDYIGYNYRINPHSLTTSYRADRFEKCLALYHEEARVLAEAGLYELCRYRLVRQFMLYLRMCFAQVSPQSSKLSKKEAVAQIRQICGNSQVQQMIREYPVSKLGMKQKGFVYLVKYKAAGILYYLH